MDRLHYNETDYFLQNSGSDIIYKNLISNLIKPPIGVSRWREVIDLSDQQIKTAFTFARMCSSSVFDHAFQYKIVVQILPTGKYLHRYQVNDSDLCSRCLRCTDTVFHNLYQCSRLTPYLSACLEYLRVECNVVDLITSENYLFGFTGSEREGLNHILLELKKHIFYEWNENVGIISFCEQFKSKLRALIINEKIIAHSNFNSKWKKFISIYDYRGPDMPQIYS